MRLSVMLIACVVFSSFVDVQKDKVLVATFQGVDDNDRYEFEDEDENIVLFDEINEEVEIDLEDEDYIGVTFTITWDEYELENEEVEESEGENEVIETEIANIKIKRILKLVIKK